MMRFIIVAIIMLSGAAFSSPLSQLYSGSSLWIPSTLLGEGNVNSLVRKALNMTTTAGALMVLFVLFTDAAARFLREGILLKDAFRFLFRHILMAFFCTSTVVWMNSVNSIIVYPSEAIINVVKNLTTDAAMEAYGTALLTSAKASHEGIVSLATTIFTQGVGALFVSILTAIAFVISFAISLYIAVMWVILFAVGPIMLPFVNFHPLSSIGFGWLRSFLAFNLMGMVGALAMALLIGSGMLSDAVKLGAGADLIPALSYSTVIVVAMVMVPRFTLKLFDGVGSDALGVARTIGAVGATVASAGILAAGVASMGAGSASSVAGSALSHFGASKAGQALENFGASTSKFGAAVAGSQLPNLQRGAFPTFRTFKGEKKGEA